MRCSTSPVEQATGLKRVLVDGKPVGPPLKPQAAERLAEWLEAAIQRDGLLALPRTVEGQGKPPKVEDYVKPPPKPNPYGAEQAARIMATLKGYGRDVSKEGS